MRDVVGGAVGTASRKHNLVQVRDAVVGGNA
jgi:hypothetical protein